MESVHAGMNHNDMVHNDMAHNEMNNGGEVQGAEQFDKEMSSGDGHTDHSSHTITVKSDRQEFEEVIGRGQAMVEDKSTYQYAADDIENQPKSTVSTNENGDKVIDMHITGLPQAVDQANGDAGALTNENDLDGIGADVLANWGGPFPEGVTDHDLHGISTFNEDIAPGQNAIINGGHTMDLDESFVENESYTGEGSQFLFFSNNNNNNNGHNGDALGLLTFTEDLSLDEARGRIDLIEPNNADKYTLHPEYANANITDNSNNDNANDTGDGTANPFAGGNQADAAGGNAGAGGNNAGTGGGNNAGAGVRMDQGAFQSSSSSVSQGGGNSDIMAMLMEMLGLESPEELAAFTDGMMNEDGSVDMDALGEKLSEMGITEPATVDEIAGLIEESGMNDAGDAPQASFASMGMINDSSKYFDGNIAQMYSNMEGLGSESGSYRDIIDGYSDGLFATDFGMGVAA